jgi:DNA-binding NtrC family response regulator
VASTGEALERLSENSYPIVISDIYIDDRTGLDVLDAARNKDPQCSVILMTARGTMETVMAATRGGAFDYVAKPFEIDRMLDTIKRAEAARQDKDEEAGPDDLPESEMIGSSAAMVEIYKTASQVAPTDATVLIEGETGTGKELVARMIHRFSAARQPALRAGGLRADRPSLLESELFGALKGALHRRRPRPHGRDRIRQSRHRAAGRDRRHRAELPVQAAALPAGARDPPGRRGARKQVDVRVLAATNRDMQKMVDEGKFREDLWFRLNVVRIVIPPLRERRGDVPLLARFFLNKYNARYSRERADGIRAEGAAGICLAGNVRQLQHLIERLTILAPNGRIDAEAVQQALSPWSARRSRETLAEAEEEQIRRVLAATGGNKSRAAQILGIERKTLYRKLERMKSFTIPTACMNA